MRWGARGNRSPSRPEGLEVVELALRRSYTFIVMAMAILLATPHPDAGNPLGCRERGASPGYFDVNNPAW